MAGRVNRVTLDARPTRQDPRIAALLHARLAIGQARSGDRSGDRTGAGRSLLAAERAYDRVGTEPPPPWLAFLNESELSGLAAIAHQAMGHYARAEDATVQALELLEPSMRRNRAYYSVQLAQLQLAQGNRDQAAATAATVDATVSSQRIGDRLAAVHRSLTSGDAHDR